MLAFELALYVSDRWDVPTSVVEECVPQVERVAIVEDELTRRWITDPSDPRARSRDVFESAAHRLEALLATTAA
jgi:hypothetical protein